MGFGEVLKHLRKQSGLAGTEVARRLGSTKRSYSGLEAQKGVPHQISTIRLLSETFGEIIWHICGFDTIKEVRTKLDALSKMPRQHSIPRSRGRYRMRVLWKSDNITTVSSKGIHSTRTL